MGAAPFVMLPPLAVLLAVWPLLVFVPATASVAVLKPLLETDACKVPTALVCVTVSKLFVRKRSDVPAAMTSAL